MLTQPYAHRHAGKSGWLAIGALAASLAFVALMIMGGLFKAVGTHAHPDAEPPTLVIQAN